MMAQAKAMKSDFLTAHGGGAGCIRLQGAKKRRAEGKDLNTLVYNAVKEVIKSKKLKAKASNESVSEDEYENFNFEILKIGEEWHKSCMPRSDSAEVPKIGTEAEKGIYKISPLINPNQKKKRLHTCNTRKCERKTW